MIDAEVERLRRLRESALQFRAVARALARKRATRDDVLLNQGRCAAWRVARTVTGRLRAHPNFRYQKDAGFATLLKNSLVAAATSATASNRRRVMTEFGAQLKRVMRELDNARALTWAADLSDNFGRSQRELRSLAEAIQCETREHGNDASGRRVLHDAAAVAAGSPFLTI